MSGSPTFDTEKKNRHGGILRLRLAYGRRSNKQLLNSVLVGYEELLRPRFVLSAKPKVSASADNTNRGLNNSSYPTRTEFNNCFIIYLYLRTFFMKKSFVL